VDKEELEAIAEKYNAAGAEAPIVVGHPKDNSPAFGWVKSLKLFGDKLLALPSKIVPEFVEAVQKGLYRNRSISLNGDGTLRHVGFLGGTPPAVKGLADVQFNEGEDVTSFEFAEPDGTDGFDSAQTPEGTPRMAHAGAGPLAPMIAISNNVAALREQAGVKQFSAEEFAEVDQRRKQAEEALSNLRMRIRKSEFEQFLNEQIAWGNVTPAMKPKLEQVLEALGAVDMQETDAEGNAVYNFADGTKGNPVEIFKEFVKGLPKVIEFKEIATAKPAENVTVVPNSETTADAIRANMKQPL